MTIYTDRAMTTVEHADNDILPLLNQAESDHRPLDHQKTQTPTKRRRAA
jgi:hypothetical protein